MSLLAASGEPQQLTGLTGWIAQIIESAGLLGVGLLVAAENIVPPVPSEIVLALAGYLAGTGRFNLVLVVVAATLGSLAGALLLYWLGARIGHDRLRRLMDRLPLVDPEELDRAESWFARYGRWAVLIGRVVPVVRSLISVPAGSQRLPLGQFVLLTAVGSTVWNTLLVGAGYALGARWQDVARYSDWFNWAIFAVFGALLVRFVVTRVRRRQAVRN